MASYYKGVVHVFVMKPHNIAHIPHLFGVAGFLYVLNDMKKEMVISVSTNNSNINICSLFAFLRHPFERKPDNCARVLGIAVATSGVDSVSFVEGDKSKILVKGDEVDAVKLTKKLRKSMGYANLEKMSDVPKSKEDPPKPVQVEPLPALVGPPAITPIWEVPPQHHEPVCCSIM